ncbi:MAG: cytochrome b/b6 domain-containing protein [Deltaproteobacteria bacterium]|nr:cytochrome b/b6 domain-containing protein [Deltaproteobacteria bacterium]
MKPILALLRKVLPGTLMALLFAVLAATGFFLHWSPRFQSIQWGLTEMVHVWIGWASLMAVGGYLIHHLARTWGPWTTRQRLLGILLTADVVAALLTGIVVVWPPGGGPPSWAVPVHFASTFALLGLFVLHSAVGWTRWLKRRWRLVIDGPAPVASSEAAASEPAAPQGDQPQEPEDEGDTGADEPSDEGNRAVDEPQ